MIFFTGITRNARDVLSRQKEQTAEKLAVLQQLCDIALEMRNVLSSGGDLNGFGRLLHEGWELKKSLEATITSGALDGIYERGLRAGALGGKLLGAGGGGFLLFYCEPGRQRMVREELSELVEVPFSLEPEGSKVVFPGSERR